jgi:regulator of sirC expression with transglutaminase-like and TPR domain
MSNLISERPSHHWSKERLHADVQRAVGGTLNLLREVSRFSEHLDPEFHAEWMVKRVQFLSYELQSEIHADHSEAERLGLLNRFFFETKKFKCITDVSKLADPSEAYRLNRVLSERRGAPIALELIYAYLAEKIGVSLDFVDLKPTCFLRWVENGRSRFVDITRGGSTLSSDELIETLHTRFRLTSFCNASLLETYSFDTYLADYLRCLKSSIDVGHEPEKLLWLQDNLISYQPSNLQLLGERALLHRRLGNFKHALADLKRYYAFHDRDRSPVELAKLYDELVALLERGRPDAEF